MENSMAVPQKTKYRTKYMIQQSLIIYLDKTFKKTTCTLMIIRAWVTIAKTWKSPKCPSTDEWIKKKFYIHIYIYIYICIYNGMILSFKKGQNNVICSNMNATRDSHTKSEKEKWIPYSFSHYMWNQIYDTDDPI